MNSIVQKIIILLFLVCITPSYFAFSFSLDNTLTNNNMELRAIKLFQTIQCLVCSGESIYESQSQFAHNMRTTIRNYITNGYTDKQIIIELRKLYGNKISNIPPYNSKTYLLWISPILIISFLIVIVVMKIKLLNS
ncbi:cytochrome c-type biogenesis protein CcmH [Neoehrlichia mikurensis]|uniref:Cytochrome c-type biogenesis protein n=1 Tax=Neoehrlichia mikurensis TaxID=89586 RepID=A0A9Q9BUZ6_9RICK|nr:cytochrome c-type biogenesis protein CcmH [Neoehrlichia mikurensis]QXK91905.1 cytochrome c-type biogenesis protein CcmH [Neoehrlichia mikurensis]QXK93118.1 cytochrome c-type biogenesis protein CcmH [Neoehrlichia mikurensis]QXK93598.1 cytochrome c-type biogenesis protein CcmH [Neoehrlichia mikurensis]UTO55448.1 cytochrome c-type biogenesis protein CcmH [Neoehrlichia mikurensis]UTO56368.1 cytochrome c-type biogenesis protein CcmH [Neoehrlichia mikurensis]